MPRDTQKRTRIEHRRSRVAELYLKGWTQAEIAGELGVSQATVSGDIKANRKEWKTSRLESVEEMIEEDKRRFIQVFRETWSAWEASRQPAETTRITKMGDKTKAEKVVREQHGDPRLLKLLFEMVTKRWELFKPEQATTSGLKWGDDMTAEDVAKHWEILMDNARAKAKEKEDYIKQRIANGI